MNSVPRQRLSLAEWAVLGLLHEEQEPTYGLVLVGLLDRDGSLGRVWTVPRAIVYRALRRLTELGLIQELGEQRSRVGPVRWLYQISPAGRDRAVAWLSRPVEHPRDVRSELLVKLALLDRNGIGTRSLLQAQLAQLRPVAAALDDQLRAATGFDRTLVLWRHETITATVRFLEALIAQQQAPAPA
jgi:DNA-binding PadR family transcriptional regulator